MGIPAPTELLLILGILLVVFGPKRIPEMMSGIAQGIKTFKKSMDTDEPAVPPQVTQDPRSASEKIAASQDSSPTANPK